jgi:hypothetical protein
LVSDAFVGRLSGDLARLSVAERDGVRGVSRFAGCGGFLSPLLVFLGLFDAVPVAGCGGFDLRAPVDFVLVRDGDEAAGCGDLTLVREVAVVLLRVTFAGCGCATVLAGTALLAGALGAPLRAVRLVVMLLPFVSTGA